MKKRCIREGQDCVALDKPSAFPPKISLVLFVCNVISVKAVKRDLCLLQRNYKPKIKAAFSAGHTCIFEAWQSCFSKVLFKIYDKGNNREW